MRSRIATPANRLTAIRLRMALCCPSRDCRRQKLVPATFDVGSWVPSTSIVVASGPVDELAQDVHMTGVAGGLFDHVKQYPSH